MVTMVSLDSRNGQKCSRIERGGIPVADPAGKDFDNDPALFGIFPVNVDDLQCAVLFFDGSGLVRLGMARAGHFERFGRWVREGD